MSFDLILRGGRVIDPSQGLDAISDVGFRDGRIAQVGAHLSGDTVKDVKGLIVTPGLIDLHTHVYWGGTSLGIDAEDFARRSAVNPVAESITERIGSDDDWLGARSGASRARTDDLRHAMAALSQLSYSPSSGQQV